MLRGLYISASGMAADALRLDTVANNLANAATTGYKRDTTVARSFEGLLLERIEAGSAPWLGGTAGSVGPLGLGTYVEGNGARITSGSLQPTGNPLDVAILGDGFFTIMTPQGIRYTRQGHFVRDAEGRLSTPEGHLVLVEGAPVGEAGADLRLGDDGNVWLDEAFWGTLDMITSREAGPLRKEGEGRWVRAGRDVPGLLALPAETAEPEQNGAGGPYRLRVGFLEASNVEPVREMVQLITVLRSYEANQRALQAHDETLGKAVNDVPGR